MVNPLSAQVTSSSAFRIIVEKSGKGLSAVKTEPEVVSECDEPTEEASSPRVRAAASVPYGRPSKKGLNSKAEALRAVIPITSRAYQRRLVFFGIIG
jgi:hypothetical protein